MGRLVRLQGRALTFVNLLVDTSVWSLAFRRDAPAAVAEMLALKRAIESGDTLVTTGLVLQELLQGFSGPKARSEIISRFGALPLLTPDRLDHVDAATLRNSAAAKVFKSAP